MFVIPVAIATGILTRFWRTFVNVLVAQFTREARATRTRVIVDAIKTLFGFWALDPHTVVNVGGTSCPLKPRDT